MNGLNARVGARRMVGVDLNVDGIECTVVARQEADGAIVVESTTFAYASNRAAEGPSGLVVARHRWWHPSFDVLQADHGPIVTCTVGAMHTVSVNPMAHSYYSVNTMAHTTGTHYGPTYNRVSDVLKFLRDTHVPLTPALEAALTDLRPYATMLAVQRYVDDYGGLPHMEAIEGGLLRCPVCQTIDRVIPAPPFGVGPQCDACAQAVK